MALFVKIVVFKTKLFKVDWSGSARLLREQRAGETPQALTPRRLTARTKESEHLEGKSTTPHYLVNSNKVCENSLKKRNRSLMTGFLFDYGSFRKDYCF
ncbi:hypothetical protein QNH26_13055 [Peribacillus frigoritolerans]|uniref:hypothetical protein n=1 Tax=Peribacillus frigoritolerans TaxID=450367 RepID=UPI0024C113CB|nr:hypothetical protein [Peribacillus frigoritolerans]WHX69423.1 hypothetical protein QNH26_13055 [Peribacillus frigoritolerans]